MTAVLDRPTDAAIDRDLAYQDAQELNGDAIEEPDPTIYSAAYLLEMGKAVVDAATSSLTCKE